MRVVPLVNVPERDTANFDVEDVHVGSLLRFHGKRQPGKVFRCCGFYGWGARQFARPRQRAWGPWDVVRLVAIDGTETRNIGLAYCSLSALWHLVEES